MFWLHTQSGGGRGVGGMIKEQEMKVKREREMGRAGGGGGGGERMTEEESARPNYPRGGNAVKVFFCYDSHISFLFSSFNVLVSFSFVF